MEDRQPRALGAQLRWWRRAGRLTQEELAERAGVSAHTISDLERGVQRTPYPETIRRLVAALDLGPEERARFEAGVRGALPRPAVGVFPALPVEPAASLPDELTSFIGREREQAAICSLLRSGTRLLTLAGTGGSGKTRLAVRIGRSLLPVFADGVFFVSLAELVSPQDVLPAIASALSVREMPGHDLTEFVRRYLQGKRLLLILDNFEHLLDAGPAVRKLLEGSCEVRILITSRAPLHVQGEREFPLQPLPVPDVGQLRLPDELARCESVALFVARAQAVAPDFALTADNAMTVAEICARLDGLPLAIELAATRLRVFSPPELLHRLGNRFALLSHGAGDAPARHQTLRAAIDWSYELLSEAERTLLARLSVFAGGCTLNAASAVCNPDDDLGVDLLDAVTALVEHGLLRRVETADRSSRFQMLETVREYAAERLEERADAECTRRLHADYFSALAQPSECRRIGVEPGAWFDRLIREHAELRGDVQAWFERLERERDNLRAALRWLLGADLGERALRLAVLLGPFWDTRSYFTEGQYWVEEALRRSQQAPAALRARGYSWASWLATSKGEFEHAAALGEEGLLLFRQAGSRDVPLGLVVSAIQRGDYATIRGFLERDLAECHELGDEPGIIGALHFLGEIALDEGDLDGAIVLSEESSALARGRGNTQFLVHTLNNLARAFLLRGDTEQAETLLFEGLPLALEWHDTREIAFYLEAFAAASWQKGMPERAARLCGAAAALRVAINAPLSIPEAAILDQLLAPLQRRLVPDVFRARWDEGQAMTLQEAIDSLGLERTTP